MKVVAILLKSSIKKINININNMKSSSILNVVGDVIGLINEVLKDISFINY